MFNEMTQHLLSVAAAVDNYCKYLKKDTNEYATILGYVYRVHQDKIRKLSPQALALLTIYLKDVKEEDYEKHIDAYKDEVERIISESKTVKEQLKKMDQIKKKIK